MKAIVCISQSFVARGHAFLTKRIVLSANIFYICEPNQRGSQLNFAFIESFWERESLVAVDS